MNRQQTALYVVLGVLAIIVITTAPLPALAGVPIWVWVGGAIALILLLRTLIPPNTWTISSKGEVPALVAVIVGLTAINFFLYFQVESAAPIFETKRGWMHLLTYYILASASVVVFGNVEGWKRWPWAVLFFFAFWGMGTKTNDLTEGRLLAELTGGMIGGHGQSRGAPTRHASGVPRSCVGLVDKPIKLSAELVLLPDHCIFYPDVIRGVVEFYPQGGGNPIPKAPGQFVNWPSGFKARAIRAESGEAELWGVFCPLYAPRWSNGCKA
ncbi:MAG: hypothetical protein AAB449_03510 [Patescibacteria group bacterium]